MAVNLSPGAISILLSGNYETVMKPVVQVIDIRCSQTQTQVKGNRVEKMELYDGIIISDGSVCEDVMIDYKIEKMLRSKKLQKGSIVQLTQFSSNTDTLGSKIWLHIEDKRLCLKLDLRKLGDVEPLRMFFMLGSVAQRKLVSLFVDSMEVIKDHILESADWTLEE
ncbi:replication protein A 70 kDa DNA-binding subunit A-like protein [Tanacetum coccineum]